MIVYKRAECKRSEWVLLISRCCNRNQLKAWIKRVRCFTLLILLIGCLVWRISKYLVTVTYWGLLKRKSYLVTEHYYDVIQSTHIKYMNRATSVNLKERPLKLGRLKRSNGNTPTAACIKNSFTKATHSSPVPSNLISIC